MDTVRKLLADGADPNTKDHAGWTPLVCAARLLLEVALICINSVLPLF